MEIEVGVSGALVSLTAATTTHRSCACAEATVSELEARRDELAARIDQQELSPQDVDRMSVERKCVAAGLPSELHHACSRARSQGAATPMAGRICYPSRAAIASR